MWGKYGRTRQATVDNVTLHRKEALSVPVTKARTHVICNYFLLFDNNKGYAKACQFYIYTHSVTLVLHNNGKARKKVMT